MFVFSWTTSNSTKTVNTCAGAVVSGVQINKCRRRMGTKTFVKISWFTSKILKLLPGTWYMFFVPRLFKESKCSDNCPDLTSYSYSPDLQNLFTDAFPLLMPPCGYIWCRATQRIHSLRAQRWNVIPRASCCNQLVHIHSTVWTEEKLLTVVPYLISLGFTIFFVTSCAPKVKTTAIIIPFAIWQCAALIEIVWMIQFHRLQKKETN